MAWRDERDAVIADFQQFYGIALPLDDIPDADAERYAVLLEQLPAKSRYSIKLIPDLAWESKDYLLRSIDYTLRMMSWSMSNDAKRGINKPEPVKSPGEIIGAERRRDAALANRQEIDRILGIEGE